MKNKKVQSKIGKGFIIFTVVLIGLALLGLPYPITDKIAIFLLGTLIVNPILSFIIGGWIDKFGVDFLKEVSLIHNIFGFEFSFNAYGLLTFILVFILKHL